MNQALAKIDAITVRIAEGTELLQTLTDIPEAIKWLSLADGFATTINRMYKPSRVQEGKEYRDYQYRAAVFAAEFRLKAEARLGEIIKQEQEAGRLASQNTGRLDKSSTIARLSQYGLTWSDSSRAQQVAEHQDLISKLTEIALTKPTVDLPTRTKMQRIIKESKRQQSRDQNAELVKQAPPLPAGRFKTLLIDPPWDWGDEGDVDQLGRAKPDYKTMSLADIRNFSVNGETIPDKAEGNSHLYLWITNRSLPKGFGLLTAWGFRYITLITWCKPSFGMGNYFRGQTEHIMFGVKGTCPLLRHDVGTWFEAPRGDNHSGKPEYAYEIIELCSPGPWLEIFARSERKGWANWGAELQL